MRIIKEITNNFADKNSGYKKYFLVKNENNKLCFMKKYLLEYGEINVEDEFNKANKIYEILKDNKYVKGVKALKFNVKERYILFEYIKYDYVFREDYLSFFRKNSCSKIFYDVGCALAKIHKGLNNRNFNESDLISLYGDFTMNNIIVKDNIVYFIDCEPKLGENINLKKTLNKDLVTFSFFLNSIPIKNLYLSIYRNLGCDENYFLKGYVDEIGIVFNYKKYIEEKLKFYLNKLSLKPFIIRRWILNKQIQNFRNQLDNYCDYRKDYTNLNKVDAYDVMYEDRDNFHTFVWEKLENPKLLSELNKFKKNSNYLDFACGTGRVLKVSEIVFNDSYGVDVSSEMLSLAKKNTKKSKLIKLDLTRERDKSMPNKFDCISAFRFFLNANNSLRSEVIFNLSLLLNKNGKLIFNNHGNKWSFHSLFWLYYKLQGKTIRVLSYSDFKNIIEPFGLRIDKVYGYGFLPRFVYQLFGKNFYIFLDDLIQYIPFSKYFGSHQLYICKKI